MVTPRGPPPLSLSAVTPMPKDSGAYPEKRIASEPGPTRNQLVVFGFLMLTQLIATLDNQIVATAMPTIVGDLGQAEHFSWLVSAYVLAQCAVMPVYGKLGDLIGRKTVVIAALVIFTIGSLLCAVSWSMTSLILARTLQGLGNGGLLVSVFAVSADLFAPRTRAKFQSYLSFVFVFGSFIGPTLGGFLTVTLGWRSIFLVTAPMGLIAILGFLRFMPQRKSGRQPIIDYGGAVVLAMTVTTLVIWVDSARLFDGFATPVSLTLGAMALAGAALWLRIERRAPEPVVPLGLFAQRNFALLVALTLCNGAVSVGLITYFAYFLQMGVGKSPSAAGLYFIAITIGVSSGALLAGRLMSRDVHFTRPLRASFTLCALVLTLIAWLPHDMSEPFLVALFVMQGFSMGLAMNAIMLGAQISAPEGDVGAATGAISLVRTVGAALAIAIYGTIIALGMAGLDTGSGLSASEMTPALLDTLTEEARHEVVTLYSDSFTSLFQTAAGFALLGLVFACLMRR